jgi:arylsulfatase
MSKSDDAARPRRAFLQQVGAGLAAATFGGGASAAATPAAPAVRTRAQRPHNILFVFTDQERHFRDWPAAAPLPGHERLMRTGTAFAQHYCPAVMCTSSRAVLMTGLQTADNRMFENADARWVADLSTSVPTVGHMLRKAGYYTAYKGKWHLNKAFESADPDRLFTSEMEAYGFADYAWPGDLIAHELGGYRFDPMIAASAITWLRNKGQPLSEAGKPWSLTVSLVNPHDIMYFNADPVGVRTQDAGKLMMRPARAPDHPDYAATWDRAPAASLRQRFDEPGRPRAHGEYDQAWSHALGRIPLDDAHWRRFDDYYVNCIRAVDAQLAAILAELDKLKLADNTIVVFTSDHGEMGGAHGLRGKGAFAYEESLHLPLLVAHPDVRGGATCRALTSHIDLAPTFLSMAGLDAGRRGDAAGRDLPGRDLSTALTDPRGATTTSVRESILFTYSGLAQNDSGLMRVLAEATGSGKDQKTVIQESGFKPDLRKRGSLRATFDGRYKFARYFSPLQRNRPVTLDDLYRYNDVELYDLSTDPAEMRNLGAERGANDALVLRMNATLNRILDAEFGKDDGREMPEIAGIDWALDRADL